MRLKDGTNERDESRLATGEPMIDHDYRPSIAFPAPPELTKVDRANIAILLVETEKCPLILSRVLEVVREHDALPFTIAARRDTRVQIIEMELRVLPQKPALAILQGLRRLSNVRVARFLPPPDHIQQAALPAKA